MINGNTHDFGALRKKFDHNDSKAVKRYNSLWDKLLNLDSLSEEEYMEFQRFREGSMIWEEHRKFFEDYGRISNYAPRARDIENYEGFQMARHGKVTC